MKDKFFLDTNIIIYSFDNSAANKKEMAQNLIEIAVNEQTGCISFQVIQEFLNIALRKFKKPLSINHCNRYLDSVLKPLCEIYGSIEIYKSALDITERWKYSFYDSLIIASAINANCNILYSEDLQNEQKIMGLTILNPFL